MNDGFDELTTRAIHELPDGLQINVVHWLQRLGPAKASQAGPSILPLVRLVAFSEFAAAAVLRDWDWFVTHHESFASAPDRGESQPSMTRCPRCRNLPITCCGPPLSLQSGACTRGTGKSGIRKATRYRWSFSAWASWAAAN